MREVGVRTHSRLVLAMTNTQAAKQNKTKKKSHATLVTSALWVCPKRRGLWNHIKVGFDGEEGGLNLRLCFCTHAV